MPKDMTTLLMVVLLLNMASSKLHLLPKPHQRVLQWVGLMDKLNPALVPPGEVSLNLVEGITLMGVGDKGDSLCPSYNERSF